MAAPAEKRDADSPPPGLAAHSADVSSTKRRRVVLFADWKAATDPASGATYYYHPGTDQTSWTWPPESDEHADAVFTKEDFVASKQFIGKHEGMVFKTGDRGLGYYRDYPPKPTDGLSKADVAVKPPSRSVYEFLPSPAFQGRRNGMVFKRGDRGVGYYRDRWAIGMPRAVPPPEAASS